MPLVKKSARLEIGCQGWNYADWVTAPASGASIFYPRSTRAQDMLEIYARAFETVEIDSTFYAVPTASTVEGWAARTPAGFTFALKLPQIITHQLALRRGSAEVLAEFCVRARLLKEKLACVLVQLPPQFEATTDNFRALAEFISMLPPDVRFSVEFRDAGWFEATVLELLTRHGVSLALVEGQWVRRERVWRLVEQPSADFAYVRWMGERDLTRFDTVARPQDANLHAWSEVVERASESCSRVYAYFSTFYEGHAPASANKLKRILGQTVIDPQELENQPSLF
jgi:uncharacterized protein YecE (DUF72 family)